MVMAMPGLAVVPPTNVDLVEGTVITTMNARLGSSVVKITAGTSSLVLIVKRIVALKQVQPVTAVAMPGTAAVPPTHAQKERETVTMIMSVRQD